MPTLPWSLPAASYFGASVAEGFAETLATTARIVREVDDWEPLTTKVTMATWAAPPSAMAHSIPTSQVIQIPYRMLCLIKRTHDHPLAADPLSQWRLHQILVCLTDRVRVNLMPQRHLADAWQCVTGFQRASSDQEHNLFGELLTDRDTAAFVDADVHEKYPVRFYSDPSL